MSHSDLDIDRQNAERQSTMTCTKTPEPYREVFAGKQHYLMSNGSIQQVTTWQIIGPSGPVGNPLPSDASEIKLKRLNREAKRNES